MAIKWSFFLGAAAISWYFLLMHGAPLAAVLAGTAAVAAWNFWQHRRDSAGR
jgi:hypothetical protein